MYSVDEKDAVVPVADIPRPDAGAPKPVLWASERLVAVAYYAVGPGDAVALVTFDAYAHALGPPNDEALEGHPLFSRGLGNNKAFEVKGSSWIRNLERMNRVHIWHDAARFSQYRHFMITFQDATFECVAESYRVATHTGDPTKVIRRAKKTLSA